MVEFESLLENVAVFTQTEPGRVGISLFTLGVAFLMARFLQHRARIGSETASDMGRRRVSLVLARNLIFLTALILIGYTWATKIAGAALSLAAVAGAMLLVSKEFLANALGSAMLASTRPYGVGDIIEVGNIRGKVVDTDILVTTVSEILECCQLTGRTVSIPHSMLLTQPVKNLTATGAYVLNSLKVAVSPEEDIARQQSALQKAAVEVCVAWLADTDAHFHWIETHDLVELPQSRPRVLLQMPHANEYILFLQYPCRPREQVDVEQAILQLYLQYRDEPAKQSMTCGVMRPAPRQENEAERTALVAA